VFFCPHTPDEGCNCRKPLPGLVQQIGARFGADLALVHMVGASLRDLQTAHAAGCVPHLVRGDRLAGTDETTIEALLAQVPGSQVHASLAAFADWLIQDERRAKGDLRDADSRPGDLTS
jgi:D-glycero-D-manno-heptose 1,7-bisphosphate phosphatase